MRNLFGLAIFILSGSALAQTPVPGTPVSAERAKPLVRLPPPMPADFPGQCEMRYDVKPDGNVHNVEVLRCTDMIFGGVTKRTIGKWRYRAGPTRISDIEVLIKFNYSDEDGEPMPMPPLPERVGQPDTSAVVRSWWKTKTVKAKRKKDDNFCCFNHSVGAAGTVFNLDIGHCPDLENAKFGGKTLLLSKFKPARHQGEAVISDGYQAIFWSHGKKVYAGEEGDVELYCALNRPAEPLSEAAE